MPKKAPYDLPLTSKVSSTRLPSAALSPSVSRRRLLKNIIGGSMAWSIGAPLAAAEQALSESDPVALALGYKNDANLVDQTKYANYTTEQSCANCLQFKSKSDEPIGTCAIFPEKTVNANGWCKVWASS